MQTDAQKLVVVRDQFALKSLSDDALKQILSAYQEAFQRLQFLLRNLPPEGASIERELWLRTQIATIQAQFEPVANRIYQILPEAQARAFEEGLSNAQKYLEAGGITPEPVPTTTFAGVTTGGQSVSVTGNLPGFNVTKAVEKGFISPSITRQQVIAAARETGFSVLSPGGSKYGLAELLPKWMDAQSKQVERHLRAGFLVGMTNDELMREIGPLGPGRRGWAMTEAVVRTSMAEASQSAHDAFYESNADLLPGTKSGYRWWWDASNDTRLCPLCAPLDGVKFKERNDPPKPWPRHFSCRCKLLPWTATQELLEEEDGPASGSFLEATPVQYDKRGKKLPAPDGYTGENAYKRPMKIDGKQQWVRRRDLGPGQTTAGDMLQNANEHSKKLVLGKHTEKFNQLTGPGGKYEKDPQGAVRKLLGDPLPSGATAPRPVRGPKPKPSNPPRSATSSPRSAAAPPPLASSVRKPTGLGTKSLAEPSWADDIDWDELPGKLGYKDHSELDYRVEALKKFTGSQYDKMRAVQMLDGVNDDVRKLSDVGRKYVETVVKQNGYETFKQLRFDVGDKVDFVEELLSRSPRYKGSIYRGMNFSSEEDVRSFLGGLRGNTVPTMESWTRQRDIAETFSSGATRREAGPYRVIVEAENKHGVSIQDFSSKKSEREVLMPGGVRYEVIGDVVQSAGPSGSTVYTVKVRQL
jgi:hypothetical protein